MKTILTACVVFAASLTAIASDEPDKRANNDHKTIEEQKSLQGDWVPVKAELAGQPMPDAVLKTISLKLNKNEYEVLVAGKADKGTWKIDPTAKLKAMDIAGVKGPNAGKKFPCIYELRADTLRVCYDLSGKKLPTEFKTKAGTKLYLVTYKRKKST